MRATKEEARKADKTLWEAAELLEQIQDKMFKDSVNSRLLVVQEFIDSAEARLPTQAAVDRDRLRKRTRAK